ncbi:MAG: enoyl-CoA hydratase-related protein [Acidimicrobiales bacterium]
MDTLISEVDDAGIATLTLDDPDRRNTISLRMCDEIVDEMERLENSGGARAVIVTGAGKGFCAGADLGDLLTARERDNIHDIYRGFLRIAHSPLPVVAAVNGAAVGAGMNMALAADVIVAAESAKFDSRFLQIGIHPGGGHTWRLLNKTNEQVVRAMVLFGEVLDGQRAAEVGLAWRCVPDAELMGSARQLAERAASFPPRLQRLTKTAMAELPNIDTSPAAVEHEVKPQLTSMGYPEFQDLVAKLQSQISSPD